MQIQDNILTITTPAGEVALPLPAITQDATVHAWTVPTDYREAGYFASVQEAGQPQEIPACDLAATSYLGSVPYPAPAAALLERAKAAKLQEINAACDAAVFALTTTYPAAEIQSWPQQVKEADAYTANAEASVPLLLSIATQRGLDLAELVGRVHAKVDAYAVASGTMIGLRQALEDQIDAAATLEAVQAIHW